MSNKTRRRPKQNRTPQAQRTKSAPPAKMQTSTLLWIVGGAIGLAIVVAIAMSVGGSESTASAETGNPTVSGAPPPAFTETANDPAAGLPAPEVSSTDFNGNAVALAPGAKAIVFLAHWCGVCQEEVPEVQAWLDAGNSPPVPLYSVVTSTGPNRGNYPPSSWLESEGWTVPVLLDDTAGSVMVAFGGNAFPYWVFVDGDGNVAGRVAGGMDTDTIAAIMETLR